MAKNFIQKFKNLKLICIYRNEQSIKHLKKNKIIFIKKNKISSKFLVNIVNKYSINTVINFISNNDNSHSKNLNYLKIINENFFSHLKILDALRDKNITFIYFDSTEKNKKDLSAYKLSKRLVEISYEFYSKQYNLKTIQIVLPTVFGKNDLNFKRLIPYLSKQLYFQKKIKLKKQKNTIKFCFVDDVIDNIFSSIINHKTKKIKTYKKTVNSILNILSNNNQNKNRVDYKIKKISNWYIKYLEKNKLEAF